MAGISSKAAGKLENKRKYAANELQNKEFSDGSGLEVYDFNARTFDPQLGRFHQIDPLADKGTQESIAPYQYCFNNPVLQTDPDGRFPIIPIARALWQGYRIYRAAKLAKELTTLAARNPPKEVIINMVITSDAKGNTVAIPEAELPVFQQQVKAEKIETLTNQAKELNGEIKELERSSRSLERNVKEHEEKVKDYKNDPDKFDNKGELQNISPEMRQQKIDGRINALEKQVKKNKGELQKVNNKLQQSNKELQHVKKELQNIQQ